MTNGVSSLSAGASAALPLELQILELFHTGGLVVLGPSDVQKHTGVSKGTVSPKLKALAEAGYLQQVSPGRYQPGGRLFGLGMNYLGLVMTHLDEVHALTVQKPQVVRGAVSQLMSAFPSGSSQQAAEPAEESAP